MKLEGGGHAGGWERAAPGVGPARDHWASICCVCLPSTRLGCQEPFPALLLQEPRFCHVLVSSALTSGPLWHTSPAPPPRPDLWRVASDCRTWHCLDRVLGSSWSTKNHAKKEKFGIFFLENIQFFNPLIYCILLLIVDSIEHKFHICLKCKSFTSYSLTELISDGKML